MLHSLFVSNQNLTACFLEPNFDSIVGDFSLKLGEVDVNFNFGLLVGPTKLLDCLHLRLLSALFLCLFKGCRLLDAACRDKSGISAINFAVALEMDSALSREVLGGMRVVVRIGTLLLNVVQQCVVGLAPPQHFCSFLLQFILLLSLEHRFLDFGKALIGFWVS